MNTEKNKTMEKITGKLSVYFENPFWVGIFENVYNGKLSVAKFTFGAEPKDNEVYEFVLKNYYRLPFCKGIDTEIKEHKLNPKRMQRMAKREVQNVGIGTKSQQVLKMQHEENKTERKKRTKEQREAEERRAFELKQQKKKEKKRGH